MFWGYIYFPCQIDTEQSVFKKKKKITETNKPCFNPLNTPQHTQSHNNQPLATEFTSTIKDTNSIYAIMMTTLMTRRLLELNLKIIQGVIKIVYSQAVSSIPLV